MKKCRYGICWAELVNEYSKYPVDMENKIQELADKIYREGVEKGNEEAHKLVQKAREEAEAIIADAKKEAESITSDAQKSAHEMIGNAKSELRLFARQSVDALKSEIASLLTQQVVSDAVKSFVADKNALNEFMLSVASKWSADEPIVVSTADAASLRKFFAVKAKDLLDKGVKIEQVNGMKALFSISPADGSYRVDFGEEEFENYFKSFLRPQLAEMLF